MTDMCVQYDPVIIRRQYDPDDTGGDYDDQMMEHGRPASEEFQAWTQTFHEEEDDE